jgi:hypothetical protein
VRTKRKYMPISYFVILFKIFRFQKKYVLNLVRILDPETIPGIRPPISKIGQPRPPLQG